MISIKHKYIYYHVTKCGGTTIENLLLKLEGIQQKIPYTKLNHHIRKKFNIGYGNQHSLPEFYQDTLKKQYFSFTFIRNPYDRCLSEFFYLKKIKREEILNMTFSEYVKNQDSINDKFHGLSLHLYTEDCDFIGRCENFQEDFSTVCDKIGIPQQQLPHKNKSKHKHYTEYYDDETRQIVAEKFAKDIEYFGYEFGV